MSKVSVKINKKKLLSLITEIAILFISVFLVWLYYSRFPNGSAVVFLSIAFIGFTLSLICYVFFGNMRSSSDALSSQTFPGVTIDYIKRTKSPVVICKEGDIWWQNDAFTILNGNSDLAGCNFENKIGISLSSISDFDSLSGTEITYRDTKFILKSSKIAYKGIEYVIVSFDNRSEVVSLRKKLSDSEIFICRIEADSIEELEQNSGENTRAVSLLLSNTLNEWVNNNNGIIKEYKSDKYIAFFDSITIKKFIDSKFDILDKIREIKFGDSNIPVTVSIGIGMMGNTLSEKEQYTQEAFNTAIQRGGDQAVIKDSKGLQIYGGVTQSVQKKTKVRSRVIANQIIEHIKESSNVIIQGHAFPDYDAIGSCIGIAALCDYCGKEFYIITDKSNENFGICSDFISRVPWLNTENVFLSAGSATEYLNSNSLCVFVDFSSKKLAECQDIIDVAERTIYIDHHRKNNEFITQPLITYIETSASSTSELVAEMLEQAIPTNKMNEYVASLLYAGIELDTNHFIKNTGVRTLSAAMYLRARGANPTEVHSMFSTSESDYVDDARYALNTIIYHDCFAITYNEKTNNAVTAARAADRLLSVRNVKASFALCISEGVCHISARSSSNVNVSVILEKMGGGGHFDSAAARVNESIQDTIKLLLKSIDDYIENNNK